MNQPTNIDKDVAATRKKEKPSKEKKIIPKYYAGTDIRKLPKIPKNMLNDLTQLETSIMTPQQRKAYLTMIVLGLITDKFGLEVGVDQKIKAIAELNKMDLEGDSEALGGSVVITDDIPEE
jgi:hypothetical protein